MLMVIVAAVGLSVLAPTAHAAPGNSSPFDWKLTGDYWAFGAGGLVMIGIVILVVNKRRSRDLQYAEVAPGRVPSGSASRKTKRADIANAPMSDTVPNGVPPRLAGPVVNEGQIGTSDVTAMIIDMAVRGYLTIRRRISGKFTLSCTAANPATLHPVERRLYDGLFTERRIVKGSRLVRRPFSETLYGCLVALDAEIASMDWYQKRPVSRVPWLVGLLIILIGMVFLLLLLSFTEGINWLAWISLPVSLIGAGSATLPKRTRPYTADGSAAAIRCIGFKTYLSSADPRQIHLGKDTFSEHLSYAVGLDCTHEWAQLFTELDASGSVVHQPPWYTSENTSIPIWRQISHTVFSITDALNESVVRWPKLALSSTQR